MAYAFILSQFCNHLMVYLFRTSTALIEKDKECSELCKEMDSLRERMTIKESENIGELSKSSS